MAQNGIIGDDFGMDFPETQVEQKELDEENKAAKYSKSSEFKKLQKEMEARIEIHQTYLPDGRPIATVNETDEELGRRWRSANIVITELKRVIEHYQSAEEAVAEKKKK